MRIFRKLKPIQIPPEAKKHREEVRVAAKDATASLSKLNKLMDNGITLNIVLAAGGHKQ